MYNLLQDTTRYGNITLKLSNFIETVTSKLCRYDDSGKADTTTCQTYHAFASVLSKVIQEFKDEVLKIQVEVTQQGKNRLTLPGPMKCEFRVHSKQHVLRQLARVGLGLPYYRGMEIRALLHKVKLNKNEHGDKLSPRNSSYLT